MVYTCYVCRKQYETNQTKWFDFCQKCQRTMNELFRKQIDMLPRINRPRLKE